MGQLFFLPALNGGVSRKDVSDDARRAAPGYPDLTLVGHGRLLFAEVKTGTGRLTLEQAAWLEALRQVTGPPEVSVWRPEDWDTIAACVQRRPQT